ncbi:MAG: TIGR02452 family protein [Clostridiales bacterium]|nr:TIGR02452 family protein [Clostridiales bacterium]
MAWNKRNYRIAVFDDTVEQYNTNECLRQSVRESIVAQQLILEGTEIHGLWQNERQDGLEAEQQINSAYKEDANIVVSKKRSFEAAQAYTGQRVCVLNFASATNPGGGVAHGSSAQEECLCRCSTLYPCINDRSVSDAFHYRHREMLSKGTLDALYNDDCIYTPGIVVFKSDTDMPQMMPEDEWYSVDIITCAAPNLRSKPSNSMNPDSGSKAVNVMDDDLARLHAKRTGRILDIAKANGVEVIILGAFGCGAFQNPPEVVARGIYEAVVRHSKDFRTIEFAVYCTPKDSGNYDAFCRQFG